MNSVRVVPGQLEMVGVPENAKKTGAAIVLINANNDNGSDWVPNTQETIPTVRDFEHPGAIGKDDEELQAVKVVAPKGQTVRIQPSDKVKIWRNRDKTNEIQVGADGVLAFQDDTPEDFYIEGIALSEEKGEILVTLEEIAGNGIEENDSIRFSVGPIFVDLEVLTAATIRTTDHPQSGGFAIQAGGLVHGARIKAKFDLPTLAGNPGVKFIQNVGAANRRDVYYSGEWRANPTKRLHVPHNDVTFPVLDAYPPADSSSTIFYTAGFTSHGHGEYSVVDSPVEIVPLLHGANKFDKL